MADEELADVALIQVPLDLWARSTEHGQDLLREMQLIAVGLASGDPSHVSARLTELVAVLSAGYGALSEARTKAFTEAYEAGQRSIDFIDRQPVAAGPAAKVLGELLDEVDDFCRSGELLTLATPADVAEFRRWFLGEYSRQLAGEPATPWPASSEATRASAGN